MVSFRGCERDFASALRRFHFPRPSPPRPRRAARAAGGSAPPRSWARAPLAAPSRTAGRGRPQRPPKSRAAGGNERENPRSSSRGRRVAGGITRGKIRASISTPTWEEGIFARCSRKCLGAKPRVAPVGRFTPRWPSVSKSNFGTQDFPLGLSWRSFEVTPDPTKLVKSLAPAEVVSSPFFWVCLVALLRTRPPAHRQ